MRKHDLSQVLFFYDSQRQAYFFKKIPTNSLLANIKLCYSDHFITGGPAQQPDVSEVAFRLHIKRVSANQYNHLIYIDSYLSKIALFNPQGCLQKHATSRT